HGDERKMISHRGASGWPRDIDFTRACKVYMRHAEAGGHAPSTRISFPEDAPWRTLISGPYSDEPYHAFAAATSGNSSTTIRPGSQPPSKGSQAPPRTRKRPPYLVTVASTCLRYSA